MKADHLSSLLVAKQIKRLLHDSHSRAKLRIILLAADRVYLLIMSPLQVVSSYLTLFTFTPLQKEEKHCFCGTFPRVTPGCS